MLISRRSALAYGGSTVAATGISPSFASAAASSTTPLQPKTSQLVQHQLIFDGEAAINGHHVALAIPATDTAWAAKGLLTEAGIHAAILKYRMRGYRLRRLNAFYTGQGMRYAAIWQFGFDATPQLRLGMNEEQFRAETESYTHLGHTLAHVGGTATPSGPRIAAIWEKTSGARQKVLFARTEEMFDAQHRAMARDGYRLRQLAGYADKQAPRFIAVYENGGGSKQEIRHSLRASDYPALARTMMRNGLHLRDASGYIASGQPYYTAIWEAA